MSSKSVPDYLRLSLLPITTLSHCQYHAAGLIKQINALVFAVIHVSSVGSDALQGSVSRSILSHGMPRLG